MKLLIKFSIFLFFAHFNLYAQDTTLVFFHDININSGYHSNLNQNSHIKAWSYNLRFENVPSMRLYFSDYNLGSGSFIKVISDLDGYSQVINSEVLKIWKNTSAYFNGNSLRLELYVAPNETDIFFNVNKVEVDNLLLKKAQGVCYGIDDRVFEGISNTIGRIEPGGGTGFLIKYGKIMTAGHVLEYVDLLPHVIEFFVPLSNPDGSKQHPAPEHQFKIIEESVIKQKDGIGNDWAVFIAYNPEGKNPFEKYNVTGLSPYFNAVNSNSTLKINGYGVDGPLPYFGEYGERNETNEVLQSDTGYFAGYLLNSNYYAIRHKVTTTSGSSGSPIVSENGVVGIHTHGGCANPDYLTNFGTAFYGNNELQQILLKGYVICEQVFSNDSFATGSKIYVWENNSFKKFTFNNKPIYILKQLGQRVSIKAEDDIFQSEKFWLWKNNLGNYLNKFIIIGNSIIDSNNFIIKFTSKLNKMYDKIYIKTSLLDVNSDIGHIYFKDPWLIDYPDPQYGNTLRNLGMDAPFKRETSPFNPTLDSKYRGVFLNQSGPGSNWQPPYYSVKADNVQDIYLQQTGRTHKFYFQGWSATPYGSATFQNANALQTPVVFKSANATVQANYKGSLLSNSVNAFANNSQRKIVRTENGHMHLFYISMNGLWYEKSVNNGGSWYTPKLIERMQDTHIKSFSVDYVNNKIYIIAQIAIETSSIIMLYQVDENGNVVYFPDNINSTISLNDESIDATPVVAANYENILFIWKDTGGLKLKRFRWDGSSWVKSNIVNIPNTTDESINPAISLVKSWNCSKVYSHLVWEERKSLRSSKLYYTRIMFVRDYVDDISFENFEEVSRGSGYEVATKPVVVELGENNALIGFVGMRRFEAENLTPTEIRAVLTTIPFGGIFYSFGDDVLSVSLNRSNTRWVFAWSRGNDLPIQFVDSRDINRIQQLSNLKGVDVQVTNGIVADDIFAFTINTTTLPYPLNYRAIFGDQIPIDLVITEDSREGLVEKEGGVVYYSIGDIKVGDEKVEFTEIPDTVGMITLENANRYLISKPFMVNDNSGFVYTIKYGVSDSSALKEAMTNTDYIKFRVELIDANTKELLGVFDEVTYTSENLSKYENLNYYVNTNGLGERLVQLRLVIMNNVDPYYALSDKFSDKEYNLQKKKAYKEVGYRGILSPKEYNYSLSQNYPNPFNPTTKIRFSIKEEVPVVIKLYDMLGREVAILMNEVKAAGEYSYELDGGKLGLSSGVYLYQMKAGEYNSVKKLIYLK